MKKKGDRQVRAAGRPKGDAGTPARSSLLRLLRLSLKGPLVIAGMEGKTASLAFADGRTAPFPVPVLRHAVSSGLLMRQGSRLSPCEETAAWLRRAMVEEADDAFADQHRDVVPALVETGEGRSVVRRNLAESPLAALSRLKEKSGAAYLGEEALAAGERFAADFERAGLQPRITASWEPRLASRMRAQPAAAGDLTDSALGARDRLNAAIEALGPELSGVALDVCCFMKGLETVERERQWPARSAKLMLRTALMALARHYAPTPVRSRRAHRWGAEDYRPELG